MAYDIGPAEDCDLIYEDDGDEVGEASFQFQGDTYKVAEFTALIAGDELEEKGWQGVLPYGFWGGLLIRLHPSEDYVTVAHVSWD